MGPGKAIAWGFVEPCFGLVDNWRDSIPGSRFQPARQRRDLNAMSLQVMQKWIRYAGSLTSDELHVEGLFALMENV